MREDLRFLWFFEFDPGDSDKVREKVRSLDVKMKEHPGEYPKLSPSYMTGRFEGYREVEAENEEQLIRLVMHFHPEEKWKLMPIFRGSTVSKVNSSNG